MGVQEAVRRRVWSMADLSSQFYRVASPDACQPRVADDSSRSDLWVAVDNAVFLSTLSPDYFPARIALAKTVI